MKGTSKKYLDFYNNPKVSSRSRQKVYERAAKDVLWSLEWDYVPGKKKPGTHWGYWWSLMKSIRGAPSVSWDKLVKALPEITYIDDPEVIKMRQFFWRTGGEQDANEMVMVLLLCAQMATDKRYSEGYVSKTPVRKVRINIPKELYANYSRA